MNKMTNISDKKNEKKKERNRKINGRKSFKEKKKWKK